MKKSLIQLHIAILLWGFTGVLGSIISLNEAWLVWYRLAITFFSLLILHFSLKEINSTTNKQKISIGFSGAIQAIHWLCFYASIKYANVSVALICLSSTSFFTLIFQSFILKTKINIVELILSLTAIVGITLIFYSDFSLKIGIVFGILSAIFVAIVPIINKQHLVSITPATITFWSITGGLITISFLLPFYIHFFPKGNTVPTNKDILLLIFLSWVCTILTWRISLEALKKISAFTFNLSLNLEPVYGIALAIIFLKEQKNYTIYFYFGLLFILVSIILQVLILQKTKRDLH